MKILRFIGMFYILSIAQLHAMQEQPPAVAQQLSVQDVIDRGGDIGEGGYIFLSGLGITSIEGLESLPSAEFVDLSNNEIASLPKKAFARNPKLRTIILRGNPIALLPSEELIKFFPEGMYTDILEQTKEFSVNDLIAKLQSDGKNLGDELLAIGLDDDVDEDDEGAVEQRFVILDLSGRGLTSLDGIERLRELLERPQPHLERDEPLVFARDINTLQLNNNFLTVLPQGILSSFQNLKSLELADNRLTQVPMGILREDRNNPLEILILRNNKIGSLVVQNSDAAGQSVGLNPFDEYPRLKSLFLEGNQITYVPETIFGKLSNLEVINLADNKIRLLPPKLFELNKNLKRIDLHNNDLVLLPRDYFSNMPQVEEVDLSGNMLDPQEFYIFHRDINLIYAPQRLAPLAILAARAVRNPRSSKGTVLEHLAK